MTGTRSPTPTRRTLLTTIGAGIATGLGGTTVTAQEQAESGYVLVQGDRCVPVQPIQGEEPVETFYDYHIPEQYISDENGATTAGGPTFSSAGTAAFQRGQTSIAFLYQGTDRISLAVVHGSVDADDGGSVTFRFAGLPEGGEWVVKDDLYRDPDTDQPQSFDRWQTDGTDHRIDWTWGSGGTDGGVFAGLGSEFDVRVDPAFNEEAALYGEYYDGTVTDWEFVSGATGSRRISLDMDEPVRLTTGTCEGAKQSPSGEETREILFESVSAERFAYRVRVSGDIQRGAWTDPNDALVDGHAAKGWCKRGGVDDFRFSGEIEELDLTGPGRVYVNDELRRDTT